MMLQHVENLCYLTFTWSSLSRYHLCHYKTYITFCIY